mmetsp:Transcript_57322/g.148943  ORF Transcript_57322/g.148943 Transcript_57322/m.148943 type:complete len:318 (-) Transcript_57322:701-1654(-)
MRPSLRNDSTASLPPSRTSDRASSTPLPMAVEPHTKTYPDIFWIQCFTDVAFSRTWSCTYFFCLPSPGREKAVKRHVRGFLGPAACTRWSAAQPAACFLTAAFISSLKSQSSSGCRQPKKRAAGAACFPRRSSSQNPRKGATPAPAPTMITGTSFSGRWKAEGRNLASTVVPGFILVVMKPEQLPKKRGRLSGTAPSARHPMALSCSASCERAPGSWLVRLTHSAILSGNALGDEAIVNSRAFCRGQCSRNSLASMEAMPSMDQNSCMRQQSGAAPSALTASASASSLPSLSRAAGSLSVGCTADSIFLVGARARSQ